MSDEELDRLYRLPPGEFVQARNELAAALKKGGDPEAARRVRGLPKPSASAWAINQLYWTARPALSDLIAASDRHRRAQRAALAGDGSDLPAAERDRARAVEEAVRLVREILRRSGQAASDSLMRRVTTTLEALASYGSENPNPLRGRLSEDLESPGFGALSSLAPPPVPPPSASERLAQETREEEEALAQARVVLAEATARAERSAGELESARTALARAEDEAIRSASELESAKTQLAVLSRRRTAG